MKTLVIYHGHCPDGFGASWVVRKAMGEENVEFFSAIHNRPPPDVAGRDVVMVDFAYPRDVMERLVKTASSILVLDHHESAEKGLAGFEAPNFRAVFDMNKSGVGVAWAHYFPDQHMPRLLQHVQDMDIWTWRVPGTAEVMGAVFSYPYDYPTWDWLMGRVGKLRREGVALSRRRKLDIGELRTRLGGLRMNIGGHNVPVFNAPAMFAELAVTACAMEPFAGIFTLAGDAELGPRVRFSLRSAPTGLNVAEIAMKYGGGGHAHAAGFEVSLDEAMRMLALPVKEQAA